MALNIAVIGGDGIGPEVIDQALRVVAAAAPRHQFKYTTTATPYGGGHYLKTGQVMTDDDLNGLRKYDAILFGAVGRPDVKPGILERGLIIKLRFDLDQYINLRPVKLLPGVETPLKNRTPADINFDVIRENTEDLYCGAGGTLRKGTPHEIATQEMYATRFGAERCLRYAFELARRKKKAGGRGLLTLVHKTNILTHAADLWFRAFEEIGQKDFPEVQRNYHHVDACCMYLVATPNIYETIVTANMFGDIITDLAAAIAGGMGVAASGNLNPDGTAPSMFEPIHGSAPDIAGQKKANPIAAILSAAMLLKETGRIKNDPAAVKCGEAIDAAVLKVCPRFAGQRFDRLPHTTDQVAQFVIDAL